MCRMIRQREIRFSKQLGSGRPAVRERAKERLARQAHQFAMCREILSRTDAPMVLRAIDEAIREHAIIAAERDRTMDEAADLFRALLIEMQLTEARIRTASNDELLAAAEELADMLNGAGYPVPADFIMEFFVGARNAPA